MGHEAYVRVAPFFHCGRVRVRVRVRVGVRVRNRVRVRVRVVVRVRQPLSHTLPPF